jgi:allene oxide cyclase
MRKLVTVAGLVASIVLVATLVSGASQKAVTSPMTVHVIEHATTDVVIDTGKKGDTTGDLLTWHNKIFDAANQQQIGRDQGDCVRINPAEGSWECRWITWVPGGAITVEGPFYDAKDNTIAITGGKGLFKNARGTVTLKARKGGAEYAFIFNVIP